MRAPTPLHHTSQVMRANKIEIISAAKLCTLNQILSKKHLIFRKHGHLGDCVDHFDDLSYACTTLNSNQASLGYIYIANKINNYCQFN